MLDNIIFFGIISFLASCCSFLGIGIYKSFEITPIIQQCEADLPRSQTCKLVAVIDEGEE